MSAIESGTPPRTPARASDPAGALPMSRFRLIYRGASPAAYTGSAWRGAFGHALKKLVCIARGQDCPSCFLYRSCIYPYIFETPPPEDAQRMRFYPAAPHPFVLAPVNTSPDGEHVVELILFGKAAQYLAYLLHAMRSAGERQRRGCVHLLRVEQEILTGRGRWAVIHSPGDALEPYPPSTVHVPNPPPLAGLVFESPLRLRREEHYAGARDLALSDLLRNLVRRISTLAYFHAGVELDADFRSLRESAKSQVWVNSRLRWQDQRRYSSRQGRELPIGGVRGVALLRAAALGDLWPYLWLGQFTFAGKGASFGLGRYRIEQVPAE
jgi:hypothetical protein